MTPNEWILSDDTGISSKTIWAVMMGVITGPLRCNGNNDIPHDPGDFGRCYRLLSLLPEWRSRLGEMAEAFPKWKPMVDNWEKFETLWQQESITGKCPLLYAAMKAIEDECLVLDGFIKTSPFSWERKPA